MPSTVSRAHSPPYRSFEGCLAICIEVPASIYILHTILPNVDASSTPSWKMQVADRPLGIAEGITKGYVKSLSWISAPLT